MCIEEFKKEKLFNKITEVGERYDIGIKRIPTKLGMDFDIFKNIESKFGIKVIYERDGVDDVGLFSIKIDGKVNSFTEIEFNIELKRILDITKKLNKELFKYCEDNFTAMPCGVLREEKCNEKCKDCNIGLALQEEREREEEEMEKVYEDIVKSSY